MWHLVQHNTILLPAQLSLLCCTFARTMAMMAQQLIGGLHKSGLKAVQVGGYLAACAMTSPPASHVRQKTLLNARHLEYCAAVSRKVNGHTLANPQSC